MTLRYNHTLIQCKKKKGQVKLRYKSLTITDMGQVRNQTIKKQGITELSSIGDD